LLLRFNLGSEWNDTFVESDLTWNLKLTANAPIGVKVSRKAVWFVEHEELWSSGINHQSSSGASKEGVQQRQRQ
jgi:hypothetical protein